MSVSQIDSDKKKKIKLFAQVFTAIIIGLVVAPIIGLAIKGILGIIVFGLIAFTTVQFAPWFGDLIANWRLKAIKHEASVNPVETLENDYLLRQSALLEFSKAIINFSTEIRNFMDELATFKKDSNNKPEDASTFEEQLDKMKQLLKIRKNKYEEISQQLVQYSSEIKRATSIWKMGQAAASMTKAAGMSEDDFMQKLKTETALSSVKTSMNKAFAELDTLCMEESSGKSKLEERGSIDKILSKVQLTEKSVKV